MKKVTPINKPLVIEKKIDATESSLSLKATKSAASQQSSGAKKTADIDYDMGGFFQGNKANLGPIKMNAKKLDMDFDGDDFFNSFGP